MYKYSGYAATQTASIAFICGLALLLYVLKIEWQQSGVCSEQVVLHRYKLPGKVAPSTSIMYSKSDFNFYKILSHWLDYSHRE